MRVAFFLVLAVFAIYAGYVEPQWLAVTHPEIRSSKGGTPIVVAQISDLHLQTVGELEKSVMQALLVAKPDLIVISGDAVDKPESIGELDTFLAGLGPAHKIAVLGNWEYWSEIDLKQLRKTYKDRGVELLVNETARYQIKERSVVVHGLDDYTAGEPLLPIQKSQSTDTSILVQHSPGFFEDDLAELDGITLCLTGHTHGGQVTAFGLPIWTPRGSGKFTNGVYKTTACPLYVSRGIGTSILNFRFGARPELALFTI